MLRQRADEEFCTATYARLNADGRTDVDVTLSSGGHPLPLLVRAEGGVEVVGVAGMALGVVERPELTERRLTLGGGDALVLYTDGLTDAYAPGRTLTTADLVAWLEGCAGLDAHEIVERLERAVLGGDGAEPRDDIAILVLRVRR
jgi:serine phosphatase RsbU (regulator of sigma subunit)